MTDVPQPELLDAGGGPHKRQPLYDFRRRRCTSCGEFRRHHCPHCGGDKLSVNHTDDQGDGTSLKYFVCAACNERFRAVVDDEGAELPDAGSFLDGPE